MTSHPQDLMFHWLQPVLAPVLVQLTGQAPPQLTEKSADLTHNGLKISLGYLWPIQQGNVLQVLSGGKFNSGNQAGLNN